MANSILSKNNLVLRYQIGVNDEGEGVFKQQSFKNISSLATADDLLDLAELVDEVIDYNISEIKKEQTFILARN